MLIHVTTDNHIQGGARLVSEVETSIEEALTHFAAQLTRVDVHLSDQNGQKASDDDKKCTLEARLAGLQPVAVSGTGANLDQALSGALDKLTHLLEHKLGRLSEKKGRMSFGSEAAEE